MKTPAVVFSWPCLLRFFDSFNNTTCKEVVRHKGFGKGRQHLSNIRPCGKRLNLSVASSYGLASCLLVSCENADHPSFKYWTSERVSDHANSDSDIDDKSFVLNKRLVLAGLYADLRCDKLKEFTNILGVGYLSDPAFDKIRSDIDEALQEISDKSRANWAEKELHYPEGIAVATDCSWLTRGFSSLFGVTSILSAENGKILDNHISSKFCQICRKSENMTDHDCDLNHDGASTSMESSATQLLFQRSMSKFNLLYRYMVGDGDSKNYEKVRNVYPNMEVEKLEDKNHFGKRFKRQMTTIRNSLGRGMKGAGRLTEHQVTLMSYYVSSAINETAKKGGDPDELYRAMWAVYYHKISTDSVPDHRYCPKGADSWCPYRLAESEGKIKEYRHRNNIQPDCMEQIKCVFEKLTELIWLKRLCHNYHTSRNEAFHSKIWSRCSKVNLQSSNSVF